MENTLEQLQHVPTYYYFFFDETFCTQSQIIVEKFQNFRQDLSAFVRG